MATKLTLEQYIELNKDLQVNGDGSTNKKCPICNENVVVEKHTSSYTVKCVGGCFNIDCRGI